MNAKRRRVGALAALVLMVCGAVHAEALGATWEGWKALEAYERGDYAAAVRGFRQGAEQGDARAQTRLGSMYANGEGVPEDDRQAVFWYRKAAEQGFAPAQFNLGIMYANGEGVPEDDWQAVAWYRKAAEQGNAPAQSNLGLMYDNGEGVPEDDRQAVAWYRKAAEQGLALAQFNLGSMYDNGQGVPEDYIRAYVWYNLAAAAGLEQAKKNKIPLRRLMTPAQIAEAQALSRTLAESIRTEYAASKGECQPFRPSRGLSLR